MGHRSPGESHPNLPRLTSLPPSLPAAIRRTSALLRKPTHTRSHLRPRTSTLPSQFHPSLYSSSAPPPPPPRHRRLLPLRHLAEILMCTSIFRFFTCALRPSSQLHTLLDHHPDITLLLPLFSCQLESRGGAKRWASLPGRSALDSVLTRRKFNLYTEGKS